MPGLALKLGPQERFLVNGVIMQNGAKRSTVTILTPDTNVLRLKEAIHPEAANTPVARVCYIAQLVLTGDADRADARMQINKGIEQLSQVFTDADSRKILEQATTLIAEDKFYPGFKALRTLLPREARLFELSRPI